MVAYFGCTDSSHFNRAVALRDASSTFYVLLYFLAPAWRNNFAMAS